MGQITEQRTERSREHFGVLKLFRVERWGPAGSQKSGALDLACWQRSLFGGMVVKISITDLRSYNQNQRVWLCDSCQYNLPLYDF